MGDSNNLLNAFTCSGAYAVLIVSGLKRVENRSSMPVPAKGHCAMSVSKKFNKREYENLVAWVKTTSGDCVASNLLQWDDIKDWPGSIVAEMDYEAYNKMPANPDLVQECRVWNEGYSKWWVLSNIQKLERPISCRGNLGMWQVDKNLLSTGGGSREEET